MSLTDWLTGKLSVSARVWTSVGPAVAILAFVALGLVVYAIRNARRGAFHDEEMDHRGLGGLIGARARHFFAWLMRPLWRGLALAEVPPNAITTLSFGLAIAAGVAVAAGRFALGGWLFVGAGALDFLDGRVARETGKTSPGGAALDSVLDRYVESALLVGLAWFYRGSWVLAATLFAITGSLFVPYVRAKGEALGAVMKDIGFMQRPERILVLGLTVAFAPAVEAFLEPAATSTSQPRRFALAQAPGGT
jgi:phosphatidylglycerophosphate synthase